MACEQSEGLPGKQEKAWPLGTPTILLRLKLTSTGKLITICVFRRGPRFHPCLMKSYEQHTFKKLAPSICRVL